MRRLISAALSVLLLLTPVFASASPTPLTAQQASRELRILKQALTDLHPGLYRYQTQAELEAEFARAEAEVAQGSDALRMHLLATRLAASVRCGHTWTNPLNQSQALQEALGLLPALPLRVRLLEGRLLVIASADPLVFANDEVLAIDGASPRALAVEFMPYLRADGSSDGKRLSQIDSTVNGGAMDRLLPLLHPPRDGRYALRLRNPAGQVREVAVAAMQAGERERALTARGQLPESEEWRLDIDGDTATLTLPTFAFWRSEFDWRGFLQRSFDTLETRGIPHLILDLRQNEGGDSAIGDALLSHLISKPHRVPANRVESAYERAPYELARFLDTWDYGFFDRTGKVRRGEGRNWVLRDQPTDKTIAPAAKPYRGRVAALTGPRMSSAGYLIARDLRASAAATLIGRPTGGNLRGLNGGELAWITLPHSGVAVDIPLIASFPTSPQPDRGVLPDIAVRTRVEDAIAKTDPDRAAALRWLRDARATP